MGILIANVILGNNIDTPQWIEKLKIQNARHIIVLDYDYYGKLQLNTTVTYISVIDFEKYIAKFDSINYYKSLYGYPGMAGKMSSLYKNQ